MKDTFDVAIVGGGVMGCATAWALAKRDVSAVLLERFEMGHTHGSSHGRSRIFRFSYPEERYVRMAQEARVLWDELSSVLGEDVVVRSGGIDAGPSVMDNYAALIACGAEAELLDHDYVFEHVPWLNPPKDMPLLFSPDGGVIRADIAWAGFAEQAAAGGVEVREGTRVTEIKADNSVRVATEGGDIEAAVAVVTAGAWSRRLLEPLGIPLEVTETRETVAYFETPVAEDFTYVEWGDPPKYALTSPGGVIKAGEHLGERASDPDDEDGASPDRESVMRLMEWVTQRFPQAAHAPDSVETCFYTNTTDRSFVLERYGDVIVGSPCSGHGFKFAPLIGERLADIALGQD